MNRKDESEIQINLLQHKIASVMQAGALILGLIGTIHHGLASLIAGLFGAWVCHLMKPGPREHLDNVTGRKKPE